MKGAHLRLHERDLKSDLDSAILQRVTSASVTVDSNLVSSIGKGILVFAAVDRDDTPKEVDSMAAKVLKMKMWPDDGGGAVRVTAISMAKEAV